MPADSVSSTLATPPPPPPSPPPSSSPASQLTGATSTSGPKPPPPSVPLASARSSPASPHASIAWKTALRDTSCARRGSSSCTSCWKGSAACAIPPTAASRAARSSAPTVPPRAAAKRSGSTLTK
eukprot:scaffold6034_cov52-Phaeocystis_antarctica.AAC.1